MCLCLCECVCADKFLRARAGGIRNGTNRAAFKSRERAGEKAYITKITNKNYYYTSSLRFASLYAWLSGSVCFVCETRTYSLHLRNHLAFGIFVSNARRHRALVWLQLNLQAVVFITHRRYIVYRSIRGTWLGFGFTGFKILFCDSELKYWLIWPFRRVVFTVQWSYR